RGVSLLITPKTTDTKKENRSRAAKCWIAISQEKFVGCRLSVVGCQLNPTSLTLECQAHIETCQRQWTNDQGPRDRETEDREPKTDNRQLTTALQGFRPIAMS